MRAVLCHENVSFQKRPRRHSRSVCWDRPRRAATFAVVATVIVTMIGRYQYRIKEHSGCDLSMSVHIIAPPTLRVHLCSALKSCLGIATTFDVIATMRGKCLLVYTVRKHHVSTCARHRLLTILPRGALPFAFLRRWRTRRLLFICQTQAHFANAFLAQLFF